MSKAARKLEAELNNRTGTGFLATGQPAKTGITGHVGKSGNAGLTGNAKNSGCAGNEPISSWSRQEHDLTSMRRSKSVRKTATAARPSEFNPGRRFSLQRQDAYRTQNSQEDSPPVQTLLDNLPPELHFLKDSTNHDEDEDQDDPLMESVLQFVELPNYEPCHVTPLGSYASSPRAGSPISGSRRSSLGKDIVKLTLHKVSIELDERKSRSDENQNTKELRDKNDSDTNEDPTKTTANDNAQEKLTSHSQDNENQNVTTKLRNEKDILKDEETTTAKESSSVQELPNSTSRARVEVTSSDKTNDDANANTISTTNTPNAGKQRHSELDESISGLPPSFLDSTGSCFVKPNRNFRSHDNSQSCDSSTNRKVKSLTSVHSAGSVLAVEDTGATPPHPAPLRRSVSLTKTSVVPPSAQS